MAERLSCKLLEKKFNQEPGKQEVEGSIPSQGLPIVRNPYKKLKRVKDNIALKEKDPLLYEFIQDLMEEVEEK